MISRQLLRDEAGVSAIEYAILAALIAVGLVGALSALGTQTGNTYTKVGDSMGVAEAEEAEPAPEAPPAREPIRARDRGVPRP
ncbi:MAG: Flp family type IVb pilin [Erythrobacter sp.]|nr:Flp family type IVb pilin [Erythrobacter sp.]NCQ63956.1 Flp family type IVb pilin [Alphaproteobacteria bacterium]